MERSEPTFVPEWYKGASSNATGSSNSNHNNISLHSDEHNSGFSLRNRLSVSLCDHDAPRSLSLSDRASSSFRRSTSSNGSMVQDKDSSRAYSSFGRSHRDRDRDRENDLDHHDRDGSLLLDNGFSNYHDSLLSNTSENDSLRRSHSVLSGRRVDSWLKRPGHDPVNGVLSGGSMITGITKSSFERDFPSLGAEDKHVGSDLVRVSSSGLSTAIHNIPVSSSGITGGDRWTSALAEVPPIAGGNGQAVTSALQTSHALATSASTSTSLNMAETLSQAPGRVRTTTKLPNDSQKIEEFHRQQILKLRPMTSSMLKNSGGPNAAEKSKAKQVSSSFHFVRCDFSKTSSQAGGQFHVLNRERNGFSPLKDTPNPTNAVSRRAPPLKNNTKLKSEDVLRCYGEKKIPNQAQKRNDFFNSLRKKTSSASQNLEEEEEVVEEEEAANKMKTSGNCGALEEPEKLAPDEEEAAFLRSLGWEENAGEEALTREEIESFLSEYKKRKPSSKLKI